MWGIPPNILTVAEIFAREWYICCQKNPDLSIKKGRRVMWLAGAASWFKVCFYRIQMVAITA